MFIAAAAGDFREGMDSPAALVQNQLALDLFSRAVFIFRLKRCDRLNQEIVMQLEEQGTAASSNTALAGPFDVRAIDIYRFRGGRLASKDTYWKKIWD